MTQAQLQIVNAGNTVTITDSLSAGHSHNYAITKWFLGGQTDFVSAPDIH